MTQHYNNLTPAQAERLALVIEECGEVIQACTKILRHGIDNFHPVTGVTNRATLTREVGDLKAAIQLLFDGNDLESSKVFAAEAYKMNQLRDWLHHNKYLLPGEIDVDDEEFL